MGLSPCHRLHQARVVVALLLTRSGVFALSFKWRLLYVSRPRPCRCPGVEGADRSGGFRLPASKSTRRVNSSRLVGQSLRAGQRSVPGPPEAAERPGALWDLATTSRPACATAAANNHPARRQGLPTLPTGERIRERRLRMGRTQAAVAGPCGITTDYLSEIERGLKIPSSQVIARLSTELQVPVGYLLGDVQPTRATSKPMAGADVVRALRPDRRAAA
ncbi:helix-turn-helix domain-containing protein (plasmid) [Streptomyces sp. NBC_00887]|nr:helix-turn-helix domain-containing protein [Streptomyces sp. NBC_00887]